MKPRVYVSSFKPTLWSPCLTASVASVALSRFSSFGKSVGTGCGTGALLAVARRVLLQAQWLRGVTAPLWVWGFGASCVRSGRVDVAFFQGVFFLFLIPCHGHMRLLVHMSVRPRCAVTDARLMSSSSQFSRLP